MSFAINVRQLQQIRTSEEHLLTRTGIHSVARLAQAIFAPACAWSFLDISFQLFQILLGGSIVNHGSRILSQVVRIAAYHDLAKISSNVASIFKSTVVIEFIKRHAIFDNYYGKQLVQVLEDCDNEFALPSSMLANLRSSEKLAEALTHGTMVCHHLNPYIANTLKG